MKLPQNQSLIKSGRLESIGPYKTRFVLLVEL